MWKWIVFQEWNSTWFSDSCGVVLEWREGLLVSKWNSCCCPSDSWEEKCSATSQPTNQPSTQPLETTLRWKRSLQRSSLRRPFFNTPFNILQTKSFDPWPKDFDPLTKCLKTPPKAMKLLCLSLYYTIAKKKHFLTYLGFMWRTIFPEKCQENKCWHIIAQASLESGS